MLYLFVEEIKLLNIQVTILTLSLHLLLKVLLTLPLPLSLLLLLLLHLRLVALVLCLVSLLLHHLVDHVIETGLVVVLLDSGPDLHDCVFEVNLGLVPSEVLLVSFERGFAVVVDDVVQSDRLV